MAATKTDKKAVTVKAKPEHEPVKVKAEHPIVKAKAEKKKEHKENRFQHWWRETLGEMRKVTWPTPQDAWRLTKIVLMVMAGMSVILGVLDFIFSQLVTWLLA